LTKNPSDKADNLSPSCAIVMKSGYPNFLEPSGSVQACNGTALPFYICSFVGVLLKYALRDFCIVDEIQYKFLLLLEANRGLDCGERNTSRIR
jgi:hypothetical protein